MNYRIVKIGDEKILVAINPGNQPSEAILGLDLSKQPEWLYGEPDAFQRDGNYWRLKLPGVAGGCIDCHYKQTGKKPSKNPAGPYLGTDLLGFIFSRKYYCLNLLLLL